MTAISIATTHKPATTAAASASATAVEETPDHPNYRAIYASTIFAVSMLFLIGVGLPTAMVYGHTTGWALGAFCAIWGGPSFGVMAGSARVSGWYENHDAHF